ncbi:hypothetical protein NJI34_05480 [Pseudomonas sp. S 311-6]|uniref:hypothetical protein n=1 Tax=Pseudomonas TaxID=286 RepID=UPI002097E7C2|nr:MULTISPECIES: hypothetical protein [Pseudomonas]MCO7563917.1 hypothetical protein [Pseudomonas mosselii]MCO7615277.1 hypothetical protein [Pseudomonas guariconensis]MCO7636240.1 hypothetical protein [Pseudomonas sp. S 311-6]
MAKPEKDTPELAGPATVEKPEPLKPITFRDKEYTYRTLILPGNRPLSVERGLVTVDGDDAVALAFFRKRPDFEQVRE